MTPDESLLLWVNRDLWHPVPEFLFFWVSERVSFSYPLLLAVLIYGYFRHGAAGLRIGLTLILMVGLGDLLGGQLKDLIGQPRPCFHWGDQLHALGGTWLGLCEDDSNGMPSNHALGFVATAVYLRYATQWTHWRQLMPAVALLVCLSRIYLGKHFPSQVVVGAYLGAVLGLAFAFGYRYFFPNDINTTKETV
ncbi:MAG: phosphatase PAP2 family protein [Chromatiales bacterium]|nr:phosphatase PAP2 family protein [Chromatiales bacterium]